MARGQIITCLNPARIEWCCQRVNMPLRALAQKTKLSEEKLRTARLTEAQLREIAKFFGYSVFFFAEKGEPQAPPPVKFRGQGGQTAANVKQDKIIRRVAEGRDLLLELLDDADEAPNFAPPKLSGGIANKAKAVRLWLQLDDKGRYEYKNYRKRVEDKGVFVAQGMGYKGNWHLEKDDKMFGFALAHRRMPAIFVRKAAKSRQAFTLFHELGHLLLHKKNFFDEIANLKRNASATEEKEANEFARLCLLPDKILDDLPAVAKPENYEAEYGGVCRMRGVGVEVALVALLKKNRIRESNYKQYKKLRGGDKASEGEANIARKRHKEPLNIFGERYVGAVLEAMQDGELTLNKASGLLDGIKTGDINKLLSEHRGG